MKLNNKTLAKVQAIKNYSGQLYFVSENDLEGAVLEPRVPDNYFVKNGYEDGENERICFSASVDGCLKGLSQNLKGKTFNVYVPESIPETVYKPNKRAVPDSDITGEYWIKEPTKIKYVGKVYVDGTDDIDGTPFEYGENTTYLYGWNYRWKQ